MATSVKRQTLLYRLFFDRNSVFSPPTVVANVKALYPRRASQLRFFKKWAVLVSQKGLYIIELCSSSAIGQKYYSISRLDSGN